MSVGQMHHFCGFGWFRSGVLLIGMWNVHSKIYLDTDGGWAMGEVLSLSVEALKQQLLKCGG
eukprot:scaffold24836_cov73-Cyclotella_meneghiniana.AAC.1